MLRLSADPTRGYLFDPDPRACIESAPGIAYGDGRRRRRFVVFDAHETLDQLRTEFGTGDQLRLHVRARDGRVRHHP